MTLKEVTRIGMPPMRHPVSPERLAHLRLAQRGVSLCEKDPSRGARLIVRILRAVISLIFDLESAELRLEIVTRENARLRERVAALEAARDVPDDVDAHGPTVLQSDWDEQPTRVGRDSERIATLQCR